MAKKKVIASEAEVDETLAQAEGSEVEEIQEEPEKSSAKSEALIEYDLPEVNGKPVEIKINGKVYSGHVSVSKEIAPLLREMADKVVERERSIFVGKKYQSRGQGSGAARYKASGNV